MSLVTKFMTYSSDKFDYEMDFFVAAKKFVAGIQFCRSATCFGSDNFFMKRPPGLPYLTFLSRGTETSRGKGQELLTPFDWV